MTITLTEDEIVEYQKRIRVWCTNRATTVVDAMAENRLQHADMTQPPPPPIVVAVRKALDQFDAENPMPKLMKERI